MLNKDGQRELAYVVRVDGIEPIPNYDRVETAIVGGWHVIVKKDQFKVGDPAIYFEIDSKVPDDMECFAFLAKRHYKVKTLKMCGTLSQGLLMHAEDFGWEGFPEANTDAPCIKDDKGVFHYADSEDRFLTKQLGVTYADAEDNQRKAPSVDKYKKMTQRHPNIFKKPWARWMMRRDWGRKVMFVFFGKKKDKKNTWPAHICDKTDVERIQNMIWILKDKQPYVATEKVDGSSCTVAVERTKWGRLKYYVCSRNVVFEDENQDCYYSNNIYFEAYKKYDLKEKITQMLNDLQLNNLAIQMEIYGDGVQKRDYSLKNERRIAVFHIVSSGVKFPMDEVVKLCAKYHLPNVPILDYDYIFPDTIEALQGFVEGASSCIDAKEKEGVVFYDKKTGQTYTKFVSPNFLLKYHA